MKTQKLIVKDNALIEASYSLDIVEQRILLLAVLAVRSQKEPIKMGQLITIHAQDYINTFNVEKHSAYKALRDGAKGLFEAKFDYFQINSTTNIIKQYQSRWIEKIGYVEQQGCIELSFGSDVIPLITELEKRFTQYEIEQVAGLQSRYAIRLYEMLIQWRSKGQMPEISLVDIRKCLGLLESEYIRMSDFKIRVLDMALKQINEHTDITATYEQHKAGRIITGFTFSFVTKEKPKELRDSKTGDLFSIGSLSDAQLARVARNKQFIADYNHLVSPNSSANSDINEWVREMVKQLKAQPEQFNKKPIEVYLI